MQGSYIHLFLYFATVYIHSDQQFNVMVKLESLEQGALTAPQVGHLEGGKRGPQTAVVLGVTKKALMSNINVFNRG